jgi:exoribonuclease-2
MHIGRIIEFIEGGGVVTAVCIEENKGRCRLLTESKREMTLPPSRFVHVSSHSLPVGQSREDMLKALRNCAAYRSQLAEKVDVSSLWDVVYEEQGEFSPKEMAELFFGVPIQDDHISAMVRAMLADRVFFQFRVDSFSPNPPETVEQILVQRARELEKAEQMEQDCQWLKLAWNGQNDYPFLRKNELIELIKDYALYEKESPKAQYVEKMFKKADITHANPAFELLVKLGVWNRDENLSIHRAGIKREFPEQVLQEACQFQRTICFLPSHNSRRSDLTALYAVTIDSSVTKDMDDALSVQRIAEGYRVGIHISDVASVIPYDCSLDKEAAQRLTSLYFPDEKIYMFPSEITENLCSLNQGCVKPTISLLMDVTEDGQLIRHHFTQAWIEVKQRLTYHEVDEAIEKGNHLLNPLVYIANHWREERLKRGALILRLPEISVWLDEAGKIFYQRRDREALSQILVSEMMIQTNYLTAKFLNQHQIPCIYRSQNEPRQRIVDSHDTDILLNFRQRKLLSRAELTLAPAFHDGLGVSDYTTATSPIRRYLDLIVQRQLAATLQGNKPIYTHEALEQILMESKETLNLSAQIVTARQRYWLLRYLESKIGNATPAFVLEQIRGRCLLLLPEYMIEMTAPFGQWSNFQKGQKITVRLTRVKPMEDTLYVEPA